MQRKAVSQQTEMSRPRFCARWRCSAQRSPGDRSADGHSHRRSRPRLLTVCVLHRTSRCRSTRSFAAQPSPGDRSVERHGGLLHGLAKALCPGFAQRVAPSPGASPHSRPQGTVSADRHGDLLHGFDKPCAQDLRSRSRRRSMCCRATSGGTTLRGGSDGGARAADGVGGAGPVCLAQALNSPRMARWMMPNR